MNILSINIGLTVSEFYNKLDKNRIEKASTTRSHARFMKICKKEGTNLIEEEKTAIEKLQRRLNILK